MDRRGLLVTVGGVGAAVSTAGCLDETGDDGGDGGADGSTDDRPSPGTASSTEDRGDEPTCYTETETDTERVVDRTRSVDGGYEWTHEYRSEAGDTVQFDISASVGQDVEAEIDSPVGRTVYTESGVSLSTTQTFRSGGVGEVRITNLGERTEEDREGLWDDRKTIGAGNQLAPWTELWEGDRVEYHVRMVDGARPQLRIENDQGSVLREHSVAAVIDDSFTAPVDGRYYFYVENTALMTSGTWDYTFERVEDVPISTRVDLTVEREFEEDVEICE